MVQVRVVVIALCMFMNRFVEGKSPEDYFDYNPIRQANPEYGSSEIEKVGIPQLRHRGLENSELASSGLVNSGSITPRLLNPGFVNPGLVSPGLVNPGLVSPGFGNPGISGLLNHGSLYPSQPNQGLQNSGYLNGQYFQTANRAYYPYMGPPSYVQVGLLRRVTDNVVYGIKRAVAGIVGIFLGLFYNARDLLLSLFPFLAQVFRVWA